MELGTLLTAAGRPFSLLITMEGFKLELDSSRFPHDARMAVRPYSRAHLPELQNSRKKISPSRSRRNAQRWQAHLLLSKENASRDRVVEGVEAAATPAPATAASPSPSPVGAPAAENLLVQQPNQLVKRGPGRPPKNKSRGLEVLRSTDDDDFQLDLSPDPCSEEETRDERLEEEEEEEEVVMEEEEEREEVVGTELETLCQQLLIIMKNDELAVAAAQNEHKDLWDPDDPVCKAYLDKLQHQSIVNESRHLMTKKYRDYWDRIQEEDEEEEEGGGEEGGGEEGGGEEGGGKK